MPYAIAAGGLADHFGAAIANACRFNDDDAAHLERTPPLGDSRRIWTFSTWAKIGNDKIHYVFTAGAGGNDYTGFRIESGGQLRYVHLDAASFIDDVLTTARLRDPSAWYHIVCAVDTTQGTAADRVRFYVNSRELTDMAIANYPSASFDTDVNAAVEHNVSNYISNAAYFDGYLAEAIFVDNQQLTPASFGQVNPVTGQWVPKTYSGTFGANGFHLDFANASDLGNDVSGNANDYTANGLATNDQVPDTPTDNHCVLNAARPSPGTLANGNLDVSGTVDAQGTFGVASGKFAWEVTLSSGGAAGIEDQDGTENTYTGSASDVIQFRLDMGAGTCDRNVNGGGWVSLATGLAGTQFPLVKTPCSLDFGQQGYLPPAGYKTLTARNLNDPGILRGDDYFVAKPRSGTGAAGSVAGLRFQPDLVWNKSRDEGAGSYTGDHKIWDALRGVTKSLESNTTDSEATEATGLSAFNSDGFDFGALDQINFSGDLFIDWCWKEGALAGFDIVSWTGDGVAGKTVAHSLGVAPNMVQVKRRESANWMTWHASFVTAGDTDYISLDLSSAKNWFGALDNWDATLPDASNITLGNDTNVNANGGTYVAYLWSEIEGFSKFGSYEGNANANGTHVWCGFRPALVMCKSIDSTSPWHIYDNAREGSNPNNDRLEADASTAEGTADEIDFLSNGFKLRAAGDPNVAETYIFAAFAEAPFKYARAR